jgi:acetyl esterase/lipase
VVADGEAQLVWSGFYSRSNKAGLPAQLQHCRDVLKKVLKHPHVRLRANTSRLVVMC